MNLIGIFLSPKMNELEHHAYMKCMKPGWFPFGHFNWDNPSQWMEQLDKKRIINNLYRAEGLNIKVSVSGIVGMNGSGKSTLLDVVFRVVNNLAYMMLYNVGHEDGRSLEFGEDLIADLYFEKDEKICCIKCDNYRVQFLVEGELLVNRYLDENYKVVVEDDDVNDYKKVLHELFFTISLNYSVFNNQHSPDDEWKHGMYHKNDGYLAPFVMAPYRENGFVDMMKEGDLARQRLLGLSILYHSRGESFIKNKVPASITYRLKRGYVDEKTQAIRSWFSNEHVKDNIHLFINTFIEKWMTIKIEGKTLREIINQRVEEMKMRKTNDGLIYMGDRERVKEDDIIAETKAILEFYPAYKALKICVTYDHYRDLLNVDAINDKQRIKNAGDVLRENEHLQNVVQDIVYELQRDKSHITLKLHQYLNFVSQSELVTYHDAAIHVDQFVEDNAGQLRSTDDVINKLWPAFYDFDIIFHPKGAPVDGVNVHSGYTLDDMSSGERQLMYLMSYVHYHIRNLISVVERDDDPYRIRYRDIMVVFDEAELYSHPDMQRCFISSLLEQLTWSNIKAEDLNSINIMLITHSPFVLSDMLTERTLFLKDGKAQYVKQQTFGANYYDILHSGFFFEENAIGELATNRLNEWITAANDGELNDNRVSEISALVGDPMLRNYITQTNNSVRYVQDR